MTTIWGRWRSPAWVGLSLVGAGMLGLLLLNFGELGSDARSYWALDYEHPYDAGMGNLSAPVAFRYGPPIALALAPMQALSWPGFLGLWFLGALVALAVLTRRWTLASIAFYPVALELSVLNIHLLLAVALVVGLRWPAAWALFPLSKVTPIICWVWFVARGEWRSLAIAAGTTAVVASVSAVLAPDLWPAWIAMLVSNVGAPAGVSLPVPLAIRLPIAVGMAAYAARTDRPWLMPVVLLLSLPTIWPQSLAVLVAIPALVTMRGRRPQILHRTFQSIRQSPSNHVAELLPPPARHPRLRDRDVR